MLSVVSFAWSRIKNKKGIGYVLVALVVTAVLIIAGDKYLNLKHTLSSHVKKLNEVSRALSNSESENGVLKGSVAKAIKQRDQAEMKYEELDKRFRDDHLRQEKTKRENEELALKMAQQQQNNPAANSDIPADVTRMHNDAIKAFNSKYGE